MKSFRSIKGLQNIGDDVDEVISEFSYLQFYLNMNEITNRKVKQ